ncbi:MAG: alanine-tRNA synthetase second additional domain-containing protein, partial [Oscillospiraceae bacterium]|nr:alanine-tRNA synthetase second additional domain-containing protein [Oscillospiraceae bacterium]
NVGFYSPHTYHVDIHFEAAFTQMHFLAEAITEAISLGKRVVVEHFDLIRPFMDQNANLLIGIGEEVIITRPTIFGPEPQAIADIVHKSLHLRYMSHTAEDLCCRYLRERGLEFTHADVRHGFILSFLQRPDIDLEDLRRHVEEIIAQDLPVSYRDDNHILIGDKAYPCTGPRMHVARTGDIQNFSLAQDFIQDPISKRFLLAGMVGKCKRNQISDLNQIEPI